MANSLDFFRMEKGFQPPPPPKPPIFERRRSFRDIQRVISKMNPEIVKSVIAHGSFSANTSSPSDASVPKLGNQTDFSPSPLCDYTLRLGCGYENNGANTAPLTIFYNGTVAVFDVSPQKAQNILEIADQRRIPKSSADYSEISSHDKKDQHLPESLNDSPITRRISLQRFLEKRRERLVTLSPYYFSTNYSTSTR